MKHEENISNLFADDRSQLEDNLEDDFSGPSITIEQITRAIKSSNDQTVGSDLVSVEKFSTKFTTQKSPQPSGVHLASSRSQKRTTQQDV